MIHITYSLCYLNMYHSRRNIIFLRNRPDLFQKIRIHDCLLRKIQRNRYKTMTGFLFILLIYSLS